MGQVDDLQCKARFIPIKNFNPFTSGAAEDKKGGTVGIQFHFFLNHGAETVYGFTEVHGESPKIDRIERTKGLHEVP